jgi:drug/metabolite transporter (DMT)-like permease
VVAFGLQFWALDHGSLVLVQPLLVSGLLFALPLGALLSRSPLRPADWLGAALVVTGLSVFLVVANPDRGHSDASIRAWLLLGLVTAVPVAGCVWAAGRVPGTRRAAFLSTAAGIVYGVTAAITKATAHLLDAGFWHAATSWKPYVGVCLGIGGMVMDQSAYQAGPLATSLPALTVADPVVSIIIGAVLFQEGVEIANGAPMVEGLALAVMIAGVFVLARSPLVISLDETEA